MADVLTLKARPRAVLMPFAGTTAPDHRALSEDALVWRHHQAQNSLSRALHEVRGQRCDYAIAAEHAWTALQSLRALQALCPATTSGRG